MRSILGMFVVPFALAWDLLEQRIWLSMIGIAILGGVAYFMKQPTITAVLVCVIATLLMRVDGLEAKAAEKAAE